jgi:hypothetical protein
MDFTCCLMLERCIRGLPHYPVYTITFKVIDVAGNMATATAKVTVPKSQNGLTAIDNGAKYTVLGGCP